jgi:hypothetical protein
MNPQLIGRLRPLALANRMLPTTQTTTVARPFVPLSLSMSLPSLTSTSSITTPIRGNRYMTVEWEQCLTCSYDGCGLCQ